MGTIMTMNSEQKLTVKPDIVRIRLSANISGMDINEITEEINSIRGTIKEAILSKKSYQSSSFKQNSLNIAKHVNTERIYGLPEDESSYISETDYKELPYNIRNKYKLIKIDNKFTGYSSNLNISAVLAISDTTVEDFIDLYELSIKRNLNFYYDCALSDKLSDSTMETLYAQCISDGIAKIEHIVSRVNSMKNRIINIVEIIDPEAISCSEDVAYARSAIRSADMARDTSEQIIIPELIEDIFNNTREVSYNLTIKADIV